MINFSSLKLTRKPNQYLVAPEEFCQKAKPHKTPPVYNASAEELFQAWEKMIAEQPRTTLIKSDNAGLIFEYVQRTALMRFPDFITVQFLNIPGQNKATLAIYSRSKFGYRDFGVNRKRIENWLHQLQNYVQIS